MTDDRDGQDHMIAGQALVVFSAVGAAGEYRRKTAWRR